MTITECRHGIIPVAACTLCNGREKLTRPASSQVISWGQRRPTAKLDVLRPEDVSEDLPSWWASAIVSGQPIDKPASCRVCPTKAPAAGNRVWAITERFPLGTWVARVNPSTHRVKGKPVCDECCRDRCHRCRTASPERHVPGRRERRSAERRADSVFAIATGHAGLSS